MESVLSILLFVAVLYLMMRYGCGAHMHGGGCGHTSRDHSKRNEDSGNHGKASANQVTRDPVCGMQIESKRASYSAQYGPDTYYFCSKECLRRFEDRPESFAEIERPETRNVA